MSESGERSTSEESGASERNRHSSGEEYARGRLSSSLQRGVGLLFALSEQRPLLGIAELAELTGLSRPTTHRYASTLLRLGYLEQGTKRKYRLALGAGEPGAEVVRELRHALRARGVLEELREEIGYTVSLGVLDRTRVLYIYRLFGHRRGQHTVDNELRTGAHIPAYCTALGKLMLASLPQSQRQGLLATIDLLPEGPRSITEHDTLLVELNDVDPRAPLLSDEEFVLGARSLAMLLPKTKLRQPTAIDVTVPSDAYTPAQLLRQIGPKLRHAARLISDT
jgi:IclR family pca regulon transcriptional regulator